MEPEAVLELMSSAPRRYETVRAALRYRGDGPTIKVLRDRFSRSEAYRRTFGLPGARPDAPSDHEPDGPFGWRCRVWLIEHHRWRVEFALPDGGVDIAASTGRMRSTDEPEGPAGTSELWERRIGGNPPSDAPRWLPYPTDTFWTMYPFDPAGICSLDGELAQLDLVAAGPVMWSGREAFRLKGKPVEEWEYPPEPLWWGADEYEAVVDAERGVLLRTASRLRGKDFDALEVEEIHFDEELPEDVFSSREPLPWR
jgi:hypothetical protein